MVSLVGTIFSGLLRPMVLPIVSARDPLLLIFLRLVWAYVFTVPRLIDACYLGVSPLLVVIALYLAKCYEPCSTINEYTDHWAQLINRAYVS